MKRGLRLTALPVAAGMALAACGADGDQAAGPDEEGDGATTLEMLVPSYSDNTQALWEGIIADCEAENPDVTIELEVQSWDNMADVVSTRLQADEAPDILNFNTYSAFSADGLLYPVEEVLSAEHVDDFQESFRELGTSDGTFYGLPLLASARALFYNQDLLDQAGVEAPPTTWEEFQAAAQAVTDEGQIGYLMPLGSEEAQAETSIFTFGAGGSWGDAEELTIVTPENIAGVTFMKQMIDAGVTQSDPGASDRTPTFELFLQGQAAMATGLPPNIAQAEEAGLNFGVTPIPTEDGENSTLGVADYIMAFDNGEDKQEAIKSFFDCFFTTENYLAFTDGENFLPTTVSGAEETVNADVNAAFLESLPDAQFYPGDNPQWLDAQNAMQTLIGQLGQGAEPEALLQEVAQQAGVDG